MGLGVESHHSGSHLYHLKSAHRHTARTCVSHPPHFSPTAVEDSSSSSSSCLSQLTSALLSDFRNIGVPFEDIGRCVSRKALTTSVACEDPESLEPLDDRLWFQFSFFGSQHGGKTRTRRTDTYRDSGTPPTTNPYIRAREARLWFHPVRLYERNTNSPTLGPRVLDNVKIWPSCAYRSTTYTFHTFNTTHSTVEIPPTRTFIRERWSHPPRNQNATTLDPRVLAQCLTLSIISGPRAYRSTAYLLHHLRHLHGLQDPTIHTSASGGSILLSLNTNSPNLGPRVQYLTNVKIWPAMLEDAQSLWGMANRKTLKEKL